MRIKPLILLIIITTAIVTMAIGFKTASSPLSIAVLGFIGWAVSPYIYLAAMLKLVSKKSSINAVLIITILVGGFGLGMFIDAMFIHIDAQGALVFVVAPLWQWGALLAASLPVYFLNKVKK